MQAALKVINSKTTYEYRGKKYVAATALEDVKELHVRSRTAAREIPPKLGIPADKWLLATVSKGVLTEDTDSKSAYVMRSCVIQKIKHVYNEDDTNLGMYGIPDKYFTGEVDNKGNSIVNALPVIDLNEEEHQTADGVLAGVGVRGIRHHRKCYFCLSDIGKAYGIENARKSVTRNRSNIYEYGVDYVKMRIYSDDGKSSTTKIFMSFLGVIRLLASTKSKHALAFIGWCCDFLVTSVMGSEEDRMRIGSKIMRISLKCASELLSRSPNVLEGIYVFAVMEKIEKIADKLGIQHHLDAGEIEPTDLLCKAGKAGKRKSTVKKSGKKYGISRRLHEHENSLDEHFDLGQSETDVVTFGLVGDRDLSGAEKELLKLVTTIARKTVVKGVKKPIKIFNHREYFIIPANRIHELHAGIDEIIQTHEVTKFKTSAELEEQKHTIALLEQKLQHVEKLLELNNKLHESEMKVLQLENSKLEKKLKRRDRTIAKLRAGE